MYAYLHSVTHSTRAVLISMHLWFSVHVRTTIPRWLNKMLFIAHTCVQQTHVQPQVTHVHAQVDLYHLHTDHPYKYISSSRYANILQFFTQGTTPAKVHT